MGWSTHQIDFSNAFVQAELKENVYLNLPPGFCGSEGTRKMVLKLKKSLYGLVQAPKAWYEYLKDKLGELEIKPSTLDPCLFFGKGLVLLVYVDDILVFGPNKHNIDELIKELKDKKMNLTVEDDVYAFLGVEVKTDSKEGVIKLNQKGLIEKVIKATGLQDANGKSTPASSSSPLGTDGDGISHDEKWNYASVIGMLMYLASNSRPEIQFAVHQCARFTHNPKQSHSNAVKRIVRYLIATKNDGLVFNRSKELKLDCYADADFAGLWSHESDQDPVCVNPVLDM